MQRALLEIVLLALVGGRSAAGSCSTALVQRRVARPRAVSRLVRRADGIPLLLGGALGRGRGGCGHRRPGRAGIGRDTAVAVVITSLFGLGALLALSPDSPPGIQELLFGDVLAVTRHRPARAAADRAARRSALLRCCTGSCSSSASTARARARSAATRPSTSRCCAARRRGDRRRAGAGEPARRRGAGRAGRLRAAPDRRLGTMVGVSSRGYGAGAAGLYVSYYARTAAGASIALCLVGAYLAALCSIRPVALRRGPDRAILVPSSPRAGADPRGVGE